jgi:hypothetical protein
MIAVATMESNNPLIILSAMLWNALYSLGAFVWNLTTTTTKMVMSAVAVLWRPVGLFLLLVATVALAALWWVVVVQLVGGMALIAVFAIVTKRGF